MKGLRATAPITSKSFAKGIRNPDLVLRVVSDAEEFFRLREEWNGLVSESQGVEIFSSWGWLYALWSKISSQENELRLFLVREVSGKLRAILPACLCTRKTLKFLSFQELTSINVAAGHPMGYFDLIALPRFRRAAVDLIVPAMVQSPWNILDFKNIPSESPLAPVLHRHLAETSGYKRRDNPTPIVELPRNWEEYIAMVGESAEEAIVDAQSAVSAAEQVKRITLQADDIEFTSTKHPFYRVSKVFGLSEIPNSRRDQKWMKPFGLERHLWTQDEQIVAELVTASCKQTTYLLQVRLGRHSLASQFLLVAVARELKEAIEKNQTRFDFSLIGHPVIADLTGGFQRNTVSVQAKRKTLALRFIRD